MCLRRVSGVYAERRKERFSEEDSETALEIK
jgi:hypothetical protein